MFYLYILRCADSTFYVGVTKHLTTRLSRHNTGIECRDTASRRPVVLAYSERFPSENAAVARETQIKRRSGEKKAALISGDLLTLKALSKRRR
jgi:predicted GIY-YIG superfamily endonuclease